MGSTLEGNNRHPDMQIHSFKFAKGNNICDNLLVFLEDKVLTEWSLLLKDRICSYGSEFFPFRVSSH